MYSVRMELIEHIQDIARARAVGCVTESTGSETWPFVVKKVPYEDVTRAADALQRSGYRTHPEHDKGVIWVCPVRKKWTHI